MISKRAATVMALFIGIILMSAFAVKPSRMAQLAPSQIMRPKSLPITDRTFLLLKTGAEVAYNRLPVHFDTTLRRFPHHAIYADMNDTIMGEKIIDCLSFLPEKILNAEEMRGYRVRRQMREQAWQWGNSKVLVDGSGTGWDLDRFKNVPAYAEAWTRDQTKDWYVMIDADSYLSAFTLQEVTNELNPDDVLYLGKAVSWGPQFAHGGSGIVLSRGAMRVMFGSTDDDIKNQLDSAADSAKFHCCGDGVLAVQYVAATGNDPSDTLQRTEFGQFQGNRMFNTIINLDHRFCTAAPTFHGVHPWEVETLDKWEREKEVKRGRMLYADYYYDFVMPYLREEIPNWIVHDGPGETDKRIWIPEDEESNNKERCIQACVDDPDCTEWTFQGGENCKIFRNLVILGEAMNPHSEAWKGEWTESSSGFMIDRIRKLRSQQKCDGLRTEEEEPDKREGWYHAKLVDAGRDGTGYLDLTQAPLGFNCKE